MCKNPTKKFGGPSFAWPLVPLVLLCCQTGNMINLFPILASEPNCLPICFGEPKDRQDGSFCFKFFAPPPYRCGNMSYYCRVFPM